MMTTPIRLRGTLAAIAMAGLAVPALGATLLQQGHVDIGIGYEAGAFDLHIHDEGSDVEYAPDEAVLGVKDAARRIVSAGLGSALGVPAGSPLWILPAVQDPDLLFLGFGAEELEPSEWVGNIGMTLKSVTGPGDVSAWSVGSLGEISVLYNSRDGLGAGDKAPVVPGSHGDYNFGFTAPGDYELVFEASGIHLLDGEKTSGSVAYAFSVIPEPSVGTLLAVGGVIFLGFRRRTRSAPATVG